MSTATSRRIARILAVAAGIALVALGTVSAVSNRVTGPEAAGGFAALIVAAAAGAYLYGTRGRP